MNLKPIKELLAQYGHFSGWQSSPLRMSEARDLIARVEYLEAALLAIRQTAITLPTAHLAHDALAGQWKGDRC